MAATNINRVILTGNLTRDPEPARRRAAPPSAPCASRSTRAEGQRVRPVGRQAQLLRRHRLGRPGRELPALPLQGPARRRRRPPGVARVAGPGRQQAPGRRHHRRLRAVPRGGEVAAAARVAAAATSPTPRSRATSPRTCRTSSARPPRSAAATATRRRPTTTSRSRPHAALASATPGGTPGRAWQARPRVHRRAPASTRRVRARRRRGALALMDLGRRDCRLCSGSVAARCARSTFETTSKGSYIGKAAQPADAPAGEDQQRRLRPPQAVPVLPRQDRVRRLQGHHDAAQVHLRPRQDPLAPHHGRLPPSSEPDRHRGQAGARAGAAALRRRVHRRRPRERGRRGRGDRDRDR